MTRLPARARRNGRVSRAAERGDGRVADDLPGASEHLHHLGRNSIDMKNLRPVFGPVFGPKLGQTFEDVSICFQVVHTYILFNLTTRASFRANFQAKNYIN